MKPRLAHVVVGGVASESFTIDNMVFQGTVLGPLLWNVFFATVTTAATSSNEHEVAFADDMNIFKYFDRNEDPATIEASLRRTRQRVHKWGSKNRVEFDPSKEHIVRIHPTIGNDISFKLLGVHFDCKLKMHHDIEDLLARCRPKIKAILRAQQCFTIHELLNQFETHI